MSNVYYGKIDNDHYWFDLTPERMGDDYVEITTEEHFRLIDSGMNIVPDENGYPKLVPYPEPTEEEKAQTEISELESYLNSTDWYATRFAETAARSQLTIITCASSDETAIAVAVMGFSTYSEILSANWPARDIFLSGVRSISDQPILILEFIAKSPNKIFLLFWYIK